MRNFAFSLVAFLALASFAAAGPEKIQSSKEMKEAISPAATNEFSWTGFYLGGRIGYGWHDGDIDTKLLPGNFFSIEPGTTSNNADGFVGGIELGYNWQCHQLVFGAEADFSGSDMSGDSNRQTRFPPSPLTGTEPLSMDINWFGTVRGRIGFAPIPRLLLYGTGGFAYANIDQSAGIVLRPNVSYLASRSDTELGWTAGAGAEFAVGRHWTIKAEYLFCDVGDESLTAYPNPPRPPYRVRYNWDTQFQTATVGLNFKF